MITPGAWMDCVNFKMLTTASQSTKTTLNTSDCFRKINILLFSVHLVVMAHPLRMFTKVLKQPFGLLRSQGHHGVVYADDSFLQGQSFEACQEYV